MTTLKNIWQTEIKLDLTVATDVEYAYTDSE